MTSPAKVTRFEITSNDPTASRTFDESLFGWSAQSDPDGSIFTIYRFAQASTPNE